MARPPSRKLGALGFVPVVYSMEINAQGNEVAVARLPKEKCRFGTFRNVTVVYDEFGRPWLRERPLYYKEILDLNLLVGGPRPYVPHVDDEGEYLKKRYPQFKDVIIRAPRHKPR